MVNIRAYAYNDLRGFNSRLHNVKSNLCTFYYENKKRFCGNYCSRKPPHGHLFNKRCWRHKKPRHSALLPPLVLLMISASERTYNRDIWIYFLQKCEKKNIPIELVIYHEDMNNATVRDPQNLISRFRPFPDIFGRVLPLRNRHGGVNFAQTVMNMQDYACKIPFASRCIVITERTVPIRPPMEIYNTAQSLKCYIDINYNTAWGPVPDGVPGGPRGRPYAAVNNYCQGLYTIGFLKEALPTVPAQCERFGITLNNGVYSVTNRVLFEQWRKFIQSNPCEFWLLNSYLLHNRHHDRPLALLRQHMERTIRDDKWIVTHVAQYREDVERRELVRRAFVFRNYTKRYKIEEFDSESQGRYYRGLRARLRKGISLRKVIRYVKQHKRRAMFFRQVEMP